MRVLLAPLACLLLVPWAAAQEALAPLTEGGWSFDAAFWTLEEGELVGRSTAEQPCTRTTWATWAGDMPGDFELVTQVKLVGGNSGVQFRSEDKGEHQVHGYQADLEDGPNWTGCLYEQNGRGVVARRGEAWLLGPDGEGLGSDFVEDKASLLSHWKPKEWNQLRVRAVGPRLEIWINDARTVEVVDLDPERARADGVLALQLHQGPPMEVRFREMVVTPLAADANDGREGLLPTEWTLTEEVETAETMEDAAPVEPAAASGEPQWIWFPGEPSANQLGWMRKEFTVPPGLKSATLFGTVDNTGEVFVDEGSVAVCRDWAKPFERELELSPGQHVLGMRVANTGGIAAAFLRLELTLADGSKQIIATGPDWRVRDRTGVNGDWESWKAAGFDDAHWAEPQLLGAFGVAPWGAPAAQSDGQVPTATPASGITVPEGFQVELLHSVPQHSQGSWVSLCEDPEGRLYASDQYGALWRVTPPPIGAPGETQVERVPVDLGHAQGLLWAHDSLFVVVALGGKNGLYRLFDTDGDDVLDEVKLLRTLGSGGEHGPHAVVLDPDGEHLWLIAGNHTPLPGEIDHSRAPRVWDEDQLLTRQPDGRGHATGKMAPGGWVVRTDKDGAHWELFAHGMRNAYDMAFSPEGELFTFDSDMEWDVGLPWYRPTRVLHFTSGAEYGWRYGTGKFPDFYEDTMGSVVDIGLSSPVGVTFATDSAFHGRWREALLIGDWSYGTIYAVFLTPDGGTWTGESEVFAVGKPFQVTDMVVAQDGALYVTTGGRRTQGGLYRISSVRPAGERPVARAATAEAVQRHALEASHREGGVDDPLGLIEALSSPDRAVRFAARTGLEHCAPEAWGQLALASDEPRAVGAAVVGLARTADGTWRDLCLSALSRVWSRAATLEDQRTLLRALQLVLVRWERPSEATQAGWGARVFAAHGTGDALTDRERIRLAIALGEPAATARALERMVEADSQEEGLFHAFALLDARAGWTLERRQAWISWMGLRGLRMQGGASIGNYVRNLRKRAAEVLTEDERRSLAQALALEPREDAPVIEASFVQSWSEQEVLPLLARVTSGRDFASGKQAFAKARCLECHRMAGEGGDLGHDLTGAGSRYSARDLMLAILEPSREISDQYQDTEVLTRDGELFIGKIVGRTDTTLSILTAPPDEGTYDLDLAEVELERPHPLSRMPAGLLDVLTEEEILNLFAYTLSGGDAQAPAFRD